MWLARDVKAAEPAGGRASLAEAGVRPARQARYGIGPELVCGHVNNQRQPPTVFIDSVGLTRCRGRSQLLQAEFAEMVLRQGYVGNLVVRFCHQHLEGSSHGRSGYAKSPQERSQRIKAACLAEVEHSMRVSAEADQVLRRFTCVLATLNVDDTLRPVVAVSIDI